MPIQVTAEVLEGLNAVRESGLTNMFVRTRVADIAGELGFDATADWIRQYPEKYKQGIFDGFEEEEEL
jgi:hypothetical protein